MTALTFPGELADDDGLDRGGCEHGAGRCTRAPEIELRIPATGATRLTCREHAGYFMLAVTASHCASAVLVRQLAIAARP